MKNSALIVLAVASLTLAACGGGGAGGTSSSSASVQSSSSSSVASVESSSSSSEATSSLESSSSTEQASSEKSSSEASSSSSSEDSASQASSSEESSSDASSSDESSSSSSVSSCSFADGQVFIDTTCTGIQAPTAYEIGRTLSYSSPELAIGDASNMITHQIIASADAGHNQVLDVVYNSSSDYNGGVHFLMPEVAPTDLSAYATGSLKFDIKVIDLGTEQKPVTFKMVCGWPCESTELLIRPETLGEWQTIEVPLSQLVERGLDLTKVTVALEVMSSWNHQSGAHFQLDNIRLETGTLLPAADKCYSRHFDSNSLVYTRVDGAMVSDANLWLSSGASITLHPQWDLLTSQLSFGAEDLTNIGNCVSQGTLYADVYIPQAYVDDGNMLLGLQVGDAFGFTELSSLSVADMKGDDWNHLSVSLAGLSLPAITYDIGVYFQPNGKPQAVTGDILVDNLVLTQESSSASSSAGSEL